MSNGDKNSLQCDDAFGKMCRDVRDIAKELGYGTLYFPTSERPSLVCEVHDGEIKQVELFFDHKSKKYR